MCTPSKASGAVPIHTAWMSSRVISHDSRAIEAACQESSLPVSNARRTNLVMPAPTTATFLIPMAPSSSRAHHDDGAAGGGNTAPRLSQPDFDLLQLALAGRTAQLQHHLQRARQAGGVQKVADAEASAGDVHRQHPGGLERPFFQQRPRLTGSCQAEGFEMLEVFVGVCIVPFFEIELHLRLAPPRPPLSPPGPPPT